MKIKLSKSNVTAFLHIKKFFKKFYCKSFFMQNLIKKNLKTITKEFYNNLLYYFRKFYGNDFSVAA